MPERLNNVIKLIESGKPAFGPFVPPGSIPDAIWIASSDYDFVVYELEHSAFSLTDLRLSLQFMLEPPGDCGIGQRGAARHTRSCGSRSTVASKASGS